MFFEMKHKILVVDDEEDIISLLKYNLQKEGYDVISASDGIEAIEKVNQYNPDLVLLDVMMPKMDGWEVTKNIRLNKDLDSTTIIILTAKGSEIDEVYGLRIGADDFIPKPVSIPKLLARIKLRLKDKTSKKFENASTNDILKFKNIELNKLKHIVKVNNKDIFFPKKEFDLLAFLIKNKGKVLRRELILNNIWGSDVFVINRTIDVHIRKLREKIGKTGDCIKTIKGVGYRLDE